MISGREGVVCRGRVREQRWCSVNCADDCSLIIYEVEGLGGVMGDGGMVEKKLRSEEEKLIVALCVVNTL